MRVANWKAPEVFERVKSRATGNALEFMDDVVDLAKAKCPTGHISRPDGWASADITFTPKTGRNKGQTVRFHTDRRWTGRRRGSLRNTIRRVGKHTVTRSNIRVYAGNFKIYWALMVEYGTASTGWGGPARKQSFLRPAWNARKKNAVTAIKNGNV